MNIYRNEKLIQRNARIAQVTMLGGLFVLAAGMFISFQYPGQFYYSLLALAVGFILSQIGIYFTNRWGRKPRPDEILDQALKGLDDKYNLYHYETPVSHLLIGPCGVWTIRTYHQRGTISFSDGRWRQKGGSLYLKIFAQESLGRPELDVSSDIDDLKKFFHEKLTEEQIPNIQAALVFTNPEVEINISEDENPPAETIYVAKLKDAIRKYAKAKTLSLDKVEFLQGVIET